MQVPPSIRCATRLAKRHSLAARVAMNAERESQSLTFLADGAELHRGAAVKDVNRLRAALDHLPTHRAGIRITGIEGLKPLLASTGTMGSIATNALDNASRPVRAILFDKTATTNWALAWHQDRTICVRKRIAIDGFGPWTIKSGLHHVAPPFDLLTRMVTLRVHLDDVSATNAPLMVATGSHNAGRVPVRSIAEVVRRSGIRACLAQAGAVWLDATPILHASQPAAAPTRRRVLQIDFAAEDLPEGLERLGI